ncbi:LysR family transcriptional regulator [Roseateles sp. DAIF2]|uniref:LysR family transcriptional regulator n=1 Tax=Roseateles sp. DAIF2 TaxID=2714952 RepID=UPI0018A25AFF|nr:LysR family transcriptional regulator [Roseateles sp. DAIF2]QPF75349.1 LysR family transcriptional regulator [Roseateles sp. DAIF2]
MKQLAEVNLNRLLFFVQVVEAGSLTGAARRMGVAKTLVSSHLQKLEQELGTGLLLRSTRSLSLTEAGEAFYEASRKIVDAADAAVSAASAASAEPRGLLRVTAPVDYGATVLTPVAVALQRRYPELRIELLSGDRLFDLVGESIDLAIRLGSLDDSGHRALRIGSFRHWLVASPAWLAERALALEHPEDLQALPMIAFAVLPHPLSWTLRHADGGSRRLRFKSSLSVNTAHALRSAALAGGGLAVLPDFTVAEDVATGRLQRLLPQWALPQGGVHAVYPATRTPTRKLRVLIEALRALDPDLDNE